MPSSRSSGRESRSRAEDEYHVLLPFIKDGLERGERAVHTIDPRRIDDLSSAKTPSDLKVLQIPSPPDRRSLLEVVIAQKASVVIGFQAMVEVNLIQVGGDQLFAELVSFRTEKWNLESRQHCN